MKGKPKYKEGQIVTFKCGSYPDPLKGEIYIIDKYGTFDNPDVSYDILVEAVRHKTLVRFPDGRQEEKELVDDCLFKHITETDIIGLWEDTKKK